MAGVGGGDDGDIGVVDVVCGAAAACGLMLALAAVAVVVGVSGAGGGRRRLWLCARRLRAWALGGCVCLFFVAAWRGRWGCVIGVLIRRF